MLNPSFLIKLGQPLQPGLVAIGKFDGKTPTLCCGTTGGKILLHSPHEGDNVAAGNAEDDNKLPTVRFLNFNKKITSIATGSLSPEGGPDTLFIGTQSNLLAYDVERNSDIFYRDVQDGANALVVGKIASMAAPLVIVGGNCSILGFNKTGNESFWTVTGDNVSALEMCDVDGDGEVELLVGSEDFEIRIFRHEELIGEVSETDRISFLKSVSKDKYCYGLGNGTVGVYKGLKNRLWRVKTKNTLSAMQTFDMDADGVPEVISGFTNGSFNVRNEATGEVKFKGSVGSSIVAIEQNDYRLNGKKELIVCSESGEIKGYLPVVAEVLAAKDSLREDLEDQRILSELQQRKMELSNELRALELGIKNAKSGEVSATGLPTNTALFFDLFADVLGGCISLHASLNTDAIIVTLIATDTEGVTLAGKEVQAVSPPSPGKKATLRLKPTKSHPCQLKIQAHVSTRGSLQQMHVLEGEVFLPRFAAYSELSVDKVQSTRPPKSNIVLQLNETVASVANWAKSSFLISEALLNRLQTKDSLRLGFLSVCGPLPATTGDSTSTASQQQQQQRDGGQLLFLEASSTAGAVRLQINSDDMDVCAELVQDLARYLKVEDLDAVADFPREFAKFEEVVASVTEANAARVRLAADMADDSQRVKALVVRAEDSRLMSDMATMRRAYTELFSMNNHLIGGYNSRAGNHEALLASLKEVNVMIQRAANLRVGKAKNVVVTESRAAVKTNNMAALVKIIRYGSSGGATQTVSKSSNHAGGR